MAASNTKFRRRHERAIANMHAGMWGAVNAHADYISDLEPRTRAPAELSRAAAAAWKDAYRKEWSAMAMDDIIVV